MSIHGVIGDVFCPGKHYFDREKRESVDGYLTTAKPVLFIENVDPRCLFTKFMLCYRST